MGPIQEKLIIIVGSGSIGRRHFQNLKKLGFTNLAFLRSTKSATEEQLDFFQIHSPRFFENSKEATLAKPYAVFIANPTSLHMENALLFAKNGAHLLIEKPLSHTTKKIKELSAIAEKLNLTVSIGYHFRFHPQINIIKKLLAQEKIGKPYFARFFTGEFLPLWHPWENYKISYASNNALGGGALLTQSHDIDTALFLFGEPESATGTASNSGTLGIDAEDNADMIINFSNNLLATFHIDYLTNPPKKTLEIFGTNGTIEWDYHTGMLALTNKKGRRLFPSKAGFERNDLFLDELRDFFKKTQGKSDSKKVINESETIIAMIEAVKRGNQWKK